MSTLNLTKYPHRRFNLLTGEWVLVSPHRTQRPWQGQNEETVKEKRPMYDEHCYLCPGNKRANGELNSNYPDTYVFTNDFAALMPQNDMSKIDLYDLLQAEKVSGTCRVICFSPRHDLTLADMEITDIQKVIALWQSQLKELEKTYQWVQVFENKGSVMGCSNPHPHGQIWASSFLPNELVKENKMQKEYFEKHGSVLLQDYAKLEQKEKERIVVENETWMVVVPFWALWPFETLLLPKISIKNLNDMNEQQSQQLASILKILLQKYDQLFGISFPYSMGWHGVPPRMQAEKYWQLHAHFYPPLLRSATVKKFMVGYEMLAEPQRDITAEMAAERLRKLKTKN